MRFTTYLIEQSGLSKLSDEELRRRFNTASQEYNKAKEHAQYADGQAYYDEMKRLNDTQGAKLQALKQELFRRFPHENPRATAVVKEIKKYAGLLIDAAEHFLDGIENEKFREDPDAYTPNFVKYRLGVLDRYQQRFGNYLEELQQLGAYNHFANELEDDIDTANRLIDIVDSLDVEKLEKQWREKAEPYDRAATHDRMERKREYYI